MNGYIYQTVEVVGHASPTMYTFRLFKFWVGLAFAFPLFIAAFIAL